MSKILKRFLVTIEIDTEKAKPFPNGFKDPATNGGDNGMNWNTYPNWDLNYQDQEHSFIASMWADFREAFKYDGLACRIFAVNSEELTGNTKATLDSILYDGRRLIENVFDEVFPYAIDPDNDETKVYFADFNDTFDLVMQGLENLQKFVDDEDSWRKGNTWYEH